MLRERTLPLGWRLALALGAMVVAVAVLAGAREDARERAAVLAAFEREGGMVPSRELAERIGEEPDVEHLRLLLARRLVVATLDPRRAAGLTDESPEAVVARAALAERLALEALPARPTAWEAPMLAGAATYLSRSLTRDPALFTDVAGWQAPLTLARELAPAQPEPSRFLALAYLELWPALSEEKRELTHRLLTEAFAEEDSFRRLVRPWLAVAPDRQTAFAPIPAEPWAWRTVADLYQAERDWPAYRDSRRAWLEALGTRIAGDLRQAARLSARGRTGPARDHYWRALAAAPPEQGFVSVARRVLAESPAGPPPADDRAAAAWLDWLLALDVVGVSPLPPAAVERLAGLVAEPPPHAAAHAALIAGRLDVAERLERRVARTWHEDWGPYLIAKAGRLAAAGDAAGARAAIERVHRDWHEAPSYWLARQRVEELTGAAAARQRLDGLTARSWPATAWRYRDGRTRLEMLVAEEARGLVVSLADVPDAGAVAELFLDGERVALAALEPGGGISREIEVATPVAPGLHLLELSPVAGGRVAPGPVRLVARR